MGLKKVVKKGVTLGFQPKRWVGLDFLKKNTNLCLDIAKSCLPKKGHDEVHQQDSRKEKLLGQQMTLSELTVRKRMALGLIVFYTICGLGFIGYALYLGFRKSLWLPCCTSLFITFLIFTHALRELMIYGQIRAKRRITLKELFQFITKGFPK